MRKKYVVELLFDTISVGLFESTSIMKTLEFLATIDRQILEVRFFTLNPFNELDVNSIMEIYKNEVQD